MRQFLKFTLASCLGIFLAFGLIFFLIIGLGVSASMTPQKAVKSNSVLEIALDYSPPELTNNVEANPMRINSGDVIGFQDILKLINRAKTDDNIKGIFLDPSCMGYGPVTGHDLLAALEDFKESGKFVLAYANFYGQGGYYLASAADTIMLNPIGGVDFRGFASFVPFFKDLMDKTGITMHIYYAGKFKSATEPFRRADMSPQNKMQRREYLEDAYGEFLSDIAEARGIDKSRLRSIADGLRSSDAEDALALGLIDVIAYEDEATAWMSRRSGLDKGEKPKRISIKDYYRSKNLGQGTGTDRVAVVFAEGSIMHCDEKYGAICDGQFVETLAKIRKSKKIKAVVLRVNSPGGSILAAENILREVVLIQKTGKSVVVSMGDYAASGGYYIACTADKIFASSATLTGSIGVFTMIPNPNALIREKLGVSFDTVRTTKHSASFSPFFEWSSEENALMKKRTDAYYEWFLEKVSNGRDMTVDEVNDVAQGRIWTGKRALEHGLVDEIGDLQDAIKSAASLANLDEYKVVEYPKLLDPWNKWITEFTKQNIETSVDKYFDAKLRRQIPHFDDLRDIITTNGPVARLPVVIQH
jgi:protease IV